MFALMFSKASLTLLKQKFIKCICSPDKNQVLLALLRDLWRATSKPKLKKSSNILASSKLGFKLPWLTNNYKFASVIE